MTSDRRTKAYACARKKLSDEVHETLRAPTRNGIHVHAMSKDLAMYRTRGIILFQNFWNCFFPPFAFCTFRTLNLTVLLRGRHCPTTTTSPSSTSLGKREGRGGEKERDKRERGGEGGERKGKREETRRGERRVGGREKKGEQEVEKRNMKLYSHLQRFTCTCIIPTNVQSL